MKLDGGERLPPPIAAEHGLVGPPDASRMLAGEAALFSRPFSMAAAAALADYFRSTSNVSRELLIFT